MTAQLCLCTLTLSCTAFFVKSLFNAQHLDPGFDVKNIVTLSFDLKYQGYDESSGRRFGQYLLQRTRALPFVQSAAIAENRLLGGFRLWENVYPKGRSSAYREGGVYSGSTLIGVGYFATVGIPLLSGREFTSADVKGSAPVAVINQTMATKLYPHENPIGRAIVIEGEKDPVQIVGIAQNSSYTTLGQNSLPFLYLSLEQRYSSRLTLHTRLRGDTTPQTIDILKREVRALDSAMPLLEARSIPAVIDGVLWAHTLTSALLTLLSLVALTLAATGIYSLAADSVNRRRREIGVRLALGAPRAGVVSMVVLQSSTSVLMGFLSGLCLAVLGKQLLAGFLFPSRSPLGELVLLPMVISLLLVTVVLLATLMPAFRAAHTHPAISLRND